MDRSHPVCLNCLNRVPASSVNCPVCSIALPGRGTASSPRKGIGALNPFASASLVLGILGFASTLIIFMFFFLPAYLAGLGTVCGAIGLRSKWRDSAIAGLASCGFVLVGYGCVLLVTLGCGSSF